MTLVLKTGKATTATKEIYSPTSLINMGAKICNKMLACTIHNTKLASF